MIMVPFVELCIVLLAGTIGVASSSIVTPVSETNLRVCVEFYVLTSAPHGAVVSHLPEPFFQSSTQSLHDVRGLTNENYDYSSTKLGDCFLHVIATGQEYNLKDDLSSYEFVENQELSVRCNVEGQYPPDRIDFIYGGNELHTERSAPYFIRGEQPDGTVNFVPYLGDTCGPKSLAIIGLGYKDEFIFDERIDFEIQCPVDPRCIVPSCSWTQIWDSDESACVDNTGRFLEGTESAFVCPSGSYKVYGRSTNSMADCECCSWNTPKDICSNRCLPLS